MTKIDKIIIFDRKVNKIIQKERIRFSNLYKVNAKRDKRDIKKMRNRIELASMSHKKSKMFHINKSSL